MERTTQPSSVTTEFAVYAEHTSGERRPLAERVATLADAQTIARDERHTHGGLPDWTIVVVAVGAVGPLTDPVIVHVVEVTDPSEPPLVFAELADAEAYLVSRGRGDESPFTQQVIDARLAAIIDGSLSAELRITAAQALACLILDRDPAPAASPDPAASVRDAHSAMRAAQRAQWTGPDSLARAFDGILVGDRGSRGHTGFSDLGQLLEDTFGGEFGAVGTSLTASTWEGIAQRLAERQDGER